MVQFIIRIMVALALEFILWSANRILIFASNSTLNPNTNPFLSHFDFDIEGASLDVHFVSTT